MIRSLLPALAALGLSALAARGQRVNTYTVRVVDEDGEPVAGATVVMVFTDVRDTGQVAQHTRRVTGRDGRAVVVRRGPFYQADFGVEKEGYYTHLQSVLDGGMRIPVRTIPRMAPEDGYVQTLVYESVVELDSDGWALQRRRTPDMDREDVHYIMRFRPRLDEEGNLVSVHYGGIMGQVAGMDSLGRGAVFRYFYNPTPNDRTLESTPPPPAEPEEGSDEDD